jgi:general secretion pathway protein A
LSSAETAAYVRHRLRVAGATREIFTPSALRELHRQAQGLPRLINVIADRAMLGAFSQDRHEISARLVRDAAAEVSGIAQGSGLWAWILAAASLLVIAGGAWFLWRSLAGN